MWTTAAMDQELQELVPYALEEQEHAGNASSEKLSLHYFVSTCSIVMCFR